MDLESESKPVSLIPQPLPPRGDTTDADTDEISGTDTERESMPPIIQTSSLGNSTDLHSDMESEMKLFILIEQILPSRKNISDADAGESSDTDSETDDISPILQLISFVISMDLETKPRRETELISLVTQAISVYKSMDLDSQPEPLSKLISFIKRNLSLVDSTDSDSKQKQTAEFWSLFNETVILKLEPESKLLSFITQNLPLVNFTDSDSAQELSIEFSSLFIETALLEPEPALLSPVYQAISLVMSRKSYCKDLISLSPQVQVKLREGKFLVTKEVPWQGNNKWLCISRSWKRIRFTGDEATHFRCQYCNGVNHKEYGKSKAPVEIKHTLHPQHSLQLVVLRKCAETRKCFCCDKDLKMIFYYCSACDFAINFACVQNPPVLFMDHWKWHEHTLGLFPRKSSLNCNLCGLSDSCSPLYICSPCDFVAHQSCLSLPRVIKISRHPHHRISFTSSFHRGEWSCAICRKKIDHVYGGFSCIKEGCSYVAHSRCATQSNIWDGEELEGEPEEYEEEYVQPFVRISDGIIQHFSHQYHHLLLDENTSRDYNENNECQACITPIYFGNFYSCVQCDFILHESCANISRKIHHPTHPHPLTLTVGYDSVVNILESCSTCPLFCTAGFFYECGKEGCRFKLHVQCATISEPLIHVSLIHPLFLTSKPGEERVCSVCKVVEFQFTKETFNCIEECNFALCFKCATLPQKVRYKHDKHTLTFSHGKETSSTTNWCEACEGKIVPPDPFYCCDEYCCVNLHIRCLIGTDFFMKTGSYLIKLSREDTGSKISVLTNNHLGCRPICSFCEKRCPHKIVVQYSGLIFCAISCLFASIKPTTKVIK